MESMSTVGLFPGFFVFCFYLPFVILAFLTSASVGRVGGKVQWWETFRCTSRRFLLFQKSINLDNVDCGQSSPCDIILAILGAAGAPAR